MYYATCDSIDDHNHSHPDSLQLEWKIGTLNFDMQMNSTLLGMMIVNTLLVCSKAIWITELEKNFFIKISDLIDRYLSSTKRGGIEGWYHNKLWASRKMQNMWWKKTFMCFTVFVLIHKMIHPWAQNSMVVPHIKRKAFIDAHHKFEGWGFLVRVTVF